MLVVVGLDDDDYDYDCDGGDGDSLRPGSLI